MSSRKANVILVNLPLHNFAAGKPSVNDGVFAAAPNLPVTHFMVVGEMSIRLFRALQRLTVRNEHVTLTANITTDYSTTHKITCNRSSIIIGCIPLSLSLLFPLPSFQEAEC